MDLQKKDILIIFLIFFLFYLINQKNEKMTDIDLEKDVKQFNDEIREDIRAITNVTNQLTTDGKITVKNLNLKGPFNILPKGTIVAWYNETPPEGWFTCDGTHGTPDLRGRFIYGYGSGLGSTIGRKGGEETHKLTTNEIPSHKHSISISGHSSHSHYVTSNNFIGGSDLEGVTGGSATRCGGCNKNKSGIDSGSSASTVGINNSSTTSSGGHNHSVTLSGVGKNQNHNNMPPYFTLKWIMKA